MRVLRYLFISLLLTQSFRTVKEFLLPCDTSNLCLSDSVPFRIRFTGSSYATDDLQPCESLEAAHGTHHENKALPPEE